MEILFQFVAAVAAGIFAGAAIYINLVEHPARIECGPALAVTEFGPSYRRATVMQVSLAIAGFLAALGAWLTRSGIEWLIGGILLVSVVPFTLICVLPTNKKLLDPALDKTSSSASQLLARWGRFHAVRSLLSLIVFFLFILSLVGRSSALH